jgi:hypothetical protein
MCPRVVSRILGLLALLPFLAAGAVSRCGADELYFGREHPHHSFGFDLDFSPLARIGKSIDSLAPQGDLFIQLTPHYWYNHLIEMHALFGYGVSYGTLELGVGAKVNLLEVFGTPGSRTVLKDVQGFGDSGLHQRGLLGNILGDFMLYIGGAFTHYSLAQPNEAIGQSYDPSVWVFEPSVGGQLYSKIPTSFARRWYLDLSLSYVPLGGTNYLAPSVGVGFELK